MDEMIDNGIIDSTANLLLDENEQVREQAALLIGSFVTSAHARTMIEPALPPLQAQLSDSVQFVREAAAWAFHKLSVNRAGCDIIVNSGSAASIIQSLMSFTTEDTIKESHGRYVILLSECLCNITNYDNGVEPLLGKKAVQSMNHVLSKPLADLLGPFK